jgi:hypothetical protein
MDIPAIAPPLRPLFSLVESLMLAAGKDDDEDSGAVVPGEVWVDNVLRADVVRPLLVELTDVSLTLVSEDDKVNGGVDNGIDDWVVVGIGGASVRECAVAMAPAWDTKVIENGSFTPLSSNTYALAICA